MGIPGDVTLPLPPAVTIWLLPTVLPQHDVVLLVPVAAVAPFSTGDLYLTTPLLRYVGGDVALFQVPLLTVTLYYIPEFRSPRYLRCYALNSDTQR